MEKTVLKRMVGAVVLTSLLPVVAHAQLFVLSPDGEDFKQFLSDGVVINLEQVPHHSSDFFNYSAAEMYYPFNVEYIDGRRWDLFRFNGNKKPVDVVITGKSKSNGTGCWKGPSRIHATFDTQGRILSYENSFHVKVDYSYNADGYLHDAVSDGNDWGDGGIRIDAFTGHVQSTLNGKPSEVIGAVGNAFYHYDDKLRVTQVDFRFTKEINFGASGGTGKLYPRTVTFNYKYDDHDNIIEIRMSNLMANPADDNTVVRMSYDSHNRLVEQVILGNYTSTHTYRYYYNERGDMVQVDKYDYFVNNDLSKPEKVSKSRYDIQYDSNGCVLSAQYHGLTHRYGDVPAEVRDWFDKWSDDGGVRVSYTYDKHGNWTALSLSYGDSAPYSTVMRRLRYEGEVSTEGAGAWQSLGIRVPRKIEGAIKTPQEISELDNMLMAAIRTHDVAQAAQVEKLASAQPDNGYYMAVRAKAIALRGRYDEGAALAKKSIKVLYDAGLNYYYGLRALAECDYMPVRNYIKKDQGYTSIDDTIFTKLCQEAVPKLEAVVAADVYNRSGYDLLENVYENLSRWNVPGYAEKLADFKEYMINLDPTPEQLEAIKESEKMAQANPQTTSSQPVAQTTSSQPVAQTTTSQPVVQNTPSQTTAQTTPSQSVSQTTSSQSAESPAFNQPDEETVTTFKGIMEQTKGGWTKDAEDLLGKFIKSDKTGYANYLKASWLESTQQWDEAMEAAKTSFEMMKKGGYDYRLPGTLILSIALKSYGNYYNERGHDKTILCKLLEKSCANVEFLRERDPQRVTGWGPVLLRLYDIATSYLGLGYKEKYNELEKELGK